MAAKASFLEEELCCSVCCDIFKDPVLLKCSHSFCRVCLQQCWEEKSSRECPVCRRRSSMDNPPISLHLKNIVESYLQQKAESTQSGEHYCSFHGQKLLFFCEDDKEALCLVCQTSEKHRNHQLCPVEEAASDLKEELKTALNPIKEKLERFTEVKQECEKTAEHIKSQAWDTEKQVKAEFEKLYQFLRDEEEARLAALREEEEQKSQMMKQKIENITRLVSTLSDQITAIEKVVDSEDLTFLKTYKDTQKRAQCTLQDPELLSGALIDVAKHLGNLKFRVWEKMLGMVQYTPVNLDPNTACCALSLSDDLTSVRHTVAQQELPNNPERLSAWLSVLGSEGFTSGQHSWEVDVGDKDCWATGVLKGSVNRMEWSARFLPRGFMTIMRSEDRYCATTSPLTCFTLKRKPRRIRVQLNYDKGELSFYNPSDMSHIYTFKESFTESLFPYFNPGSNSDGRNRGPLQICPAKVTVTVSLP